jgi:hypothetical protein
MKPLLFFLVIVAFFSVKGIAQSKLSKIVGTVYEVNSLGGKKIVPKGTSVFIPGIATSTTDDDGYYSLNLSECKTCTTGNQLKISVNSAAGYTEVEYTISNDLSTKPFNIEIKQNVKLLLTGIVKSKKSGAFLKGIRVTAVAPFLEKGNNLFSITDSDGVFQIVLRKEGIANLQAVTLAFTDVESAIYKSVEKVVYINQYAPITVEMEECDGCGLSYYKFSVNERMKTGVYVEKGDLVTIKAEGTIRVGRFVGTSGPAGIMGNKGVWGLTLADFNLFPDWNHAALVYRFGEQDEWKPYDDKSENTYTAQINGYLEFCINDKKLSDNSGEYRVQVLVKK